jgi:type I restriction enzyme S subunit
MIKAYEKYKNSGSDWINDIPQTWNVASLNHLVEFIMGQAPHSDSYNTEGIGEIFIKTGDFGDLRPSIKWFTTSPLVFASEIDVFMCVVGATSGKINLGINGTISRSIAALRPKEKILQKYLYYFLSYNYQRLNDAAQGSAQGIINKTILSNIKTPLPTIEEQTKIAQYLDHQTAIIDRIIQQKEKLIELLKEKSQAVINEAVTKGLNPNAKMKDSGIEWLGEVPEHWSVLSVNKLIEVKDGTHDTPIYVDQDYPDSYPLITSKDFKNGEIDFTNAKYISKDDHIEIIKRSNTEKGDIIMSMIGGNIGNLVFVNTEKEFSIKNVALFKTALNPILGKFLLYILKSNLLQVQIDLKSRGGAQGFLALSDLRKLIFFKTPESEIVEINNYLDQCISKIENLATQLEGQIEKLKEYRQSIISEAVTGKIDVRDWKAN